MASKLRIFALLYYLAVAVVGLLIAAWLSSIHRTPLPREEIDALAQVAAVKAWSKGTVQLSADGTLEAEAQRFASALSQALGGEIVVTVAPASAGEPACTNKDSSPESCAEALEASADVALVRHKFELMWVAADSTALVLGTGRRAYLRWQPGKPTLEELASSTAKLLQDSWFRKVSLDGGASLFEITPAYVFSFLLVGDCGARVSWSFFDVVLLPYLSRLLEKLKVLFDIEVNSQVVMCGSLGNSLEPKDQDSQSVVDTSMLQADFMRRTGEWPPDALTRDARWLPPLVRLVAFKPSTPVVLADDKGEAQYSFAVQGFGAVAIAHCDTGANASGEMTDCEAQRVASGWISSLRSWLSLPANESVTGAGIGDGVSLLAARPRMDGISDWELQMLARAVHGHFVQRTAETLRSLVELVDSLPDVVVREEIGAMAFKAAAKAQASTDAAAAGDVQLALAEAREALILALTAIHDDSVVSQLYFSWEFKYAVYLPISMPILVPLSASVGRHLRSMLLAFLRRVKR